MIKLIPITSENLALAVEMARKIFPYETHADGFWPELAYKLSIQEGNPRFRYYLACTEAQAGQIYVGITGHYPPEHPPAHPEIWLGWFGVLPMERRKGFGTQILHATAAIVSGFGVSELKIYSGDRDEERDAHRLYLRQGAQKIGRGRVDGAPVIYFNIPISLQTLSVCQPD